MNNVDWAVVYNSVFIVGGLIGILLATFALYTKKFAK